MTKTAKTYGGALYELAKEESKDVLILEQLEVLEGILRENPQYIHLISASSLTKKERCQIVDDTFSGRIDGYLLSFIKILCENGTAAEFFGCAEEYRTRYNEDNGILEAVAVSAVPLNEEQRTQLIDKLAASTGKTIRLLERIDPALIGGVRVEAGGIRYDGSISGRIDRIRQSLSEIAI